KTTDWHDIHGHLLEAFPEHLRFVPEGKLTLGLSTYGVAVSLKQQMATALAMKKLGKARQQSIRIVPNKTHQLSSAQVLHIKMVTPSSWELCFVRHQDTVVMAQTVAVQDIEAYTARDQKRPKRDTKVGM